MNTYLYGHSMTGNILVICTLHPPLGQLTHSFSYCLSVDRILAPVFDHEHNCTRQKINKGPCVYLTLREAPLLSTVTLRFHS